MIYICFRPIIVHFQGYSEIVNVLNSAIAWQLSNAVAWLSFCRYNFQETMSTGVLSLMNCVKKYCSCQMMYPEWISQSYILFLLLDSRKNTYGTAWVIIAYTSGKVKYCEQVITVSITNQKGNEPLGKNYVVSKIYHILDF